MSSTFASKKPFTSFIRKACCFRRTSTGGGSHRRLESSMDPAHSSMSVRMDEPEVRGSNSARSPIAFPPFPFKVPPFLSRLSFSFSADVAAAADGPEGGETRLLPPPLTLPGTRGIRGRAEEEASASVAFSAFSLDSSCACASGGTAASTNSPPSDSRVTRRPEIFNKSEGVGAPFIERRGSANCDLNLLCVWRRRRYAESLPRNRSGSLSAMTCSSFGNGASCFSKRPSSSLRQCSRLARASEIRF
mmetsp:Transcript_18800/g.38001  ORF Transcript_18800/g.38001 Transcript_18800/m.38001 type:complete len:247 (+) Transcript_18800:1152-1892(+)